MDSLIPETVDGSEFAEMSHDMSQAQAEQAFGAEFADEAELSALEGVNHD